MRSQLISLLVAAACAVMVAVSLPVSLESGKTESPVLQPGSTLGQPAASGNLTVQRLGGMPVAFTENRGQWDSRALFRADAGGATMWFTREGICYQFTRRMPKVGEDSTNPPQVVGHPGHEGIGGPPFMVGEDALAHGDVRQPQRIGGPPFMVGRGNDTTVRVSPWADREPDSIEHLVITAKFVGANPDVEIVGEGLMEYKCNYFLGNDPAKWRTDVPNYTAVMFKDIYPGIDLRCSGEKTGTAGYEFVAAPGADLGQVRVEYEGVEEVAVDERGRMVARTGWGEMTAVVASPAACQDLPRLAPLVGTTSSFRVSGDISPQAASLVVTLDYSTFLGGSNDEWALGIALDGAGSAYVAGYTASSEFPTPNANDASYNGNDDVFVTKLAAAENTLEYSTYLGGSSHDFGWGVTVDGSGCAYVTGWTYSSDFPTHTAYDASCNGGDAFVTKFSEAGNALVYSTFLGGSSDDLGLGIAVDGSGCVYVSGFTYSPNFPTRNAYDASHNGGSVDVFVAKLSSLGNTLVYSTFLGGSSNESAYAIAVDGSWCAYVSGHTISSDFPTQDAYDARHNGDEDVFVTKLSSSGKTLVYSTFLGGSFSDNGFGIAVDRSGCAYVTGDTRSSDFPTHGAYDARHNGDEDVFVTKLSSSGKMLVYSTFLGGSISDVGIGIAVDGSGCAYLTGYTWSSDFPMLKAYDASHNGGEYDAFVTKLSSLGNSLVYSTFLGGSHHDYGTAVVADGFGCAYVAGGTSSSNFPRQHAHDASYNGGYDAFVTKLRWPCHCTGWCDLNKDATLSATDVVLIVNYAFTQQDARQQIAGCPYTEAPNRNGDWNCDGLVNLVDVVRYVNYVYKNQTQFPPCDPCACTVYPPVNPGDCPPWP